MQRVSYSRRNRGRINIVPLWLAAYIQIWPDFKWKPVYLEANSSSSRVKSSPVLVEVRITASGQIGRGSQANLQIILNICFSLIVALDGSTCDSDRLSGAKSLVEGICQWTRGHLSGRRCGRNEALLRKAQQEKELQTERRTCVTCSASSQHNKPTNPFRWIWNDTNLGICYLINIYIY